MNGLFDPRSGGVFGPLKIGLEGARVFFSLVLTIFSLKMRPTVNVPFFDGEGESFLNFKLN